jgi:hypothetical protein
MDFSKTEEKHYAEPVVSRAHPPVIRSVTLAASDTDIPAGTVLAEGDSGYVPYVPGGEAAPAGVLTRTVEAADSEVVAPMLVHGTAVADRLSPNDTDTLAALASKTIYAV